MDKPYKDTKQSRCLQIAVTLITIALGILLAFFLCGCYPEFVKEHAACSRTFGGMIERRTDAPGDLRELGKAVRKTSEEVQRQVGLPAVGVDENNLAERLEETAEHAKSHVPLFRQLLGMSTGSDWLDMIIALIFGGGATYTAGHTVRKKLFEKKEA